MQEPNKTIKDTNECCGYGHTTRPAEDEFDKFLRVTGGETAPRGGHADSVAAHTKKVAMPTETEEKRYYHGPVGIVAPVYREDPQPSFMCQPIASVAKPKRKKG